MAALYRLHWLSFGNEDVASWLAAVQINESDAVWH